MKFEKMKHTVLDTKKSSFQMMPNGTTIETKIFGIWKTDGYDDKVPVASA